MKTLLSTLTSLVLSASLSSAAHALKHAHGIFERHREFGPAGGANQAHGTPVHEEHEHRNEVLNLGALEEAAEEQDGHAGPLKLLASVGQPVIAPAQNCLVAIPKPSRSKLLDAVDQRRRDERAIGHRDDLRPRAAGATVGFKRGWPVGSTHAGREGGEDADDF